MSGKLYSSRHASGAKGSMSHATSYKRHPARTKRDQRPGDPCLGYRAAGPFPLRSREAEGLEQRKALKSSWRHTLRRRPVPPAGGSHWEPRPWRGGHPTHQKAGSRGHSPLRRPTAAATPAAHRSHSGRLATGGNTPRVAPLNSQHVPTRAVNTDPFQHLQQRDSRVRSQHRHRGPLTPTGTIRKLLLALKPCL